MGLTIATLEINNFEFQLLNTFVNETYYRVDFKDQPEEFKSVIVGLIEKFENMSEVEND